MPRQSKVFSFLKSANGTLDISMYGVLYGDWSQGSEQAVLVDAIKACAPTDSITLHINSEGGDMFAGIAIRNILEAHPGDVTCVVEGIAASAASIAAMAGKTVMRSGAMMMIHNPWAFVAGDADDMRTAANMLDKSRDALVAIYQEKTGKSATELKALLEAETWMTADEAVENGFADEESDDDDDDDVMNVVAVNRKRVRINNVDFPRNRVPPQILAMARPLDNPTQEQAMKTVFAALSLKDNASEADALSVITKINDERKQLLALTGKESLAEAVGVLSAWKSSAAEVQALRSDMAQKAADQETRDFDAEITAAKKSGLLASSDEHKRNRAVLAFKGKPEALTSLRNFLSAIDPLVPVAGKVVAPVEPQPGGIGGVVALTDEEKRIAHKMNIPLDKVLANKQRLMLRAAAAPSTVVVDDEDDKDAA